MTSDPAAIPKPLPLRMLSASIKTIADLRGKRVPRIKANPSINIKVEAMLAFAGLTWDDVQVVEVPSYGAALQALVDGQADVAGTTPTAATLYELEGSSRGLSWAPLPEDNAEGWAAVTDVASFFAPATVTTGAGISEDNPAQIFAVRYPMITVYADADENEVYNFIKALDESFDIYKDATSAMPNWAISEAGTTPQDAPFHPGAIRYGRMGDRDRGSDGPKHLFQGLADVLGRAPGCNRKIMFVPVLKQWTGTIFLTADPEVSKCKRPTKARSSD